MSGLSDHASPFRYRALDAAGATQQGVIQAESLRGALDLLTAKGLAVIDLQATGGAQPVAATGLNFALRRRASFADHIVLLSEMATLLRAGVSLAEVAPSLEAAYSDSALAAPLSQLRQRIQGGSTVATAFSQAGFDLPDYAQTLIEAGEAAGRLGEALADAAAQMEYERNVRQEFRNALVYPAVLVGAGTLAVLIIFLAVVPRFASLLKSGRAEIPALSRWVIETGLALQAHWLGAGLVLLGLVGAIALLLRLPSVRETLLAFMARLPLSGPWLQEADIGRWATLLGTLLANRVALLMALDLSSRGLRIARNRHHVISAASEVRRGRALSEVLAEQGWIAPTRLNLIRVGERAGELPRMLSELGRIHTETARGRMKRLLALIEPLAILGIGAVIGVIMVSVMLAITSLNTARL